jgi:hypothetical protein
MFALLVAAAASAQGEIFLKLAAFDPVAAEPAMPAELRSRQGSRLWLVQYESAPLPHVRERVRELGARIVAFVPRHADLVEADPRAAARIASLPSIRWVGPYHPAYRMPAEEREALEDAAQEAAWILVASRSHDLAAKQRVARDLERAGGRLFHPIVRESFLLTMVLPPAALRAALAHDEVVWIDRWAPASADMDLVRASCGANAMTTVVPGGFRGQGVRGEIVDIGCQDTHVDLAGLIWHSATTGQSSHGTSTYAIAFGKGIGDPQGLGLLPEAQGFAGVIYDALFATNRYAYTAQLLGPAYECVFQSNSTGTGWTTSYGSISMLMDQIVFDLDLSILQSQSNQGGQSSRPEAWAKNVISVGGVFHYDTLTRSDDAWSYGASIGPAEDGRIKPDVVGFYDSIFTATMGAIDAYTPSFTGTSASTPIAAGCLGLTVQMWASGLFGPTNPGPTVFARRPHAATAKALLINSASQYPFSGLGHDLTRTHQGWGTPDLERTHFCAAAGKALVIDETIALPPLQSASFTVNVGAGELDFRATLVWTDPPGIASAMQHRINDLDLRVTSPSGVIYWGNHGLLTGNWSTPGGAPDSINTVENVFVQNPQAGAWIVTVLAREVNQDGHVETAAMDADFALVVTNASLTVPGPPDTGQANSALAALVVNGGTNVWGQNALPGVAGPFFATATPGGPLALTWSGPPNAAVVLGAAALNRNNVVFPGAGSLDIGLLGPSVADVDIVVDAGTTGPNGSATYSVTVPPLPPGVLGALQAAVMPPGQPPVLTAATQITIN